MFHKLFPIFIIIHASLAKNTFEPVSVPNSSQSVQKGPQPNVEVLKKLIFFVILHLSHVILRILQYLPVGTDHICQHTDYKGNESNDQ